MTEKPNCSTCTINDCKFHPSQKPIIHLDSPVSAIVHVSTSEFGCLTHPGAREWLMRDVISYLEQHLIFGNPDDYDKHERIKSKMAEEALSVIRGEE